MARTIYISGPISIPALREEGDTRASVRPRVCWISIPALREEGDNRNAFQRIDSCISIPALREEGDQPLFGQ